MQRSNVETTYDGRDFVMFKSTCSCGSNSHSVTVSAECDGEANGKSVSVNADSKGEKPPALVSLFFECEWLDSPYAKWHNILWSRLKAAFRLLFTGVLPVEGEFVFRSGEHLEDFQNALKAAVDQVRKD